MLGLRSLRLAPLSKHLTSKFRTQPLPRQSALWPISRRNLSNLKSEEALAKAEAGEASSFDEPSKEDKPRPEHAVISTFDLFSIGGQCYAWNFLERGLSG